MKLNYYAETDSLYIDLSEKPSCEQLLAQLGFSARVEITAA